MKNKTESNETNTEQQNIKEKINLVSNLNTINLKLFKKDRPLSYAYLCLDKYLTTSGISLYFINQDKNRVYVKVKNNINGFVSRIFDISNEEFLKMNLYTATMLKSRIWDKTI